MTTRKSLDRLQTLIWVLIYGGLLILVLGLATERNSDAAGWPLAVLGGIAAAAGVALIYVRARLKED